MNIKIYSVILIVYFITILREEDPFGRTILPTGPVEDLLNDSKPGSGLNSEAPPYKIKKIAIYK